MSFEEKSNQIRQLAALPPEKLIDHLAQAHAKTEAVAPNLMPHLHSAATNAIQYLNANLPPAGNELSQDAAPAPSKAQKDAWLKLHETLNNPLSVLEHVKNGTVTHKHVEALQAVYPDLHQEMVQKASEHLGELQQKGAKLPYARRQALAVLTGQPIDSTMTPQSMQAIMATAKNTSETQNQGPKKASGAELKQVNKVNEMLQTPDQARQTDKRG